MSPHPAARTHMVAATRIVLVPPARWDEERLMAAIRTMPVPSGPVRPGDAVGDLIVVGVEPEPGAEAVTQSVVEVKPAPRARSGRLLDLAILLDAGESMSQPWSARHTRWQAATEALQAFLKEPGAPLRLVTLFIYARATQLVAGPVASSEVKLPELTPRGRSQTGSALNAALAYLAEHAEGRTPQAVLILSDGAGEQAELARAAERSARLGVPTHVLLFSPEEDEAFAQVAQRTGGTAQRATNPPSFTLQYEQPPEEPSA